MSKWYHNGGTMPRAEHRQQTVDESFVRSTLASLKAEARALAKGAERLLANAERFAEQGGLDHVQDDHGGGQFSDAQDFVTRGLNLEFSYTPQDDEPDDE